MLVTVYTTIRRFTSPVSFLFFTFFMETMRIEKKTTRGYIIGVWRFIELICIWMLHWYWVWISNAWYHKRLSLKMISRESSLKLMGWQGPCNPPSFKERHYKVKGALDFEPPCTDWKERFHWRKFHLQTPQLCLEWKMGNELDKQNRMQNEK